ncbi:hypothetical protein EAE99_012135 [Botrytis elliptica]|nr:hypothetical protein EAE99_012135 [Botrytis elliptica]
MKNFIINFIICFLVSIAIADTHNVPLVEGIKVFELSRQAPIDLNKPGIVFRHVWSPFKWSLDLVCVSNLNNDINCNWFADLTRDQISTQPIRKDFVFELESHSKFRELDPRPIYHSRLFNIIKVNPLILPADYAEKETKPWSAFYALSVEVNCVREFGLESILWCERLDSPAEGELKNDPSHLESKSKTFP